MPASARAARTLRPGAKAVKSLFKSKYVDALRVVIRKVAFGWPIANVGVRVKVPRKPWRGSSSGVGRSVESYISFKGDEKSVQLKVVAGSGTKIPLPAGSSLALTTCKICSTVVERPAL